MSRYRLLPSPAQEEVLLRHCAHARYVWNLCIEQESHWRAGRGPMPGLAQRCRQLTSARGASLWLAEGSVTVQQQAIRDHGQAMQNFLAGTHGRPTWRKAGRDEGFRIIHLKPGQVHRLSRHIGAVYVPKAGWVRFRWSRPVPAARSYRVTYDRAGRWHIAFASIPAPVPGPRSGKAVGIDRGVAVTLALSDGGRFQAPVPRPTEPLQRKLSRAQRGSSRRKKLKLRLARLHARNANARKDWAEKRSTEIARRYDLIRIEDLRVRNMTCSARGTMEHPGRNVRQKAGLNRAILNGAWSLFAARLEHKALGRVEKIDPRLTSQRCSACGHIAAESRKSQALFACVACHFTLNADMNAARNIAAGHAVTARGGSPLGGPVNREPQLLASLPGCE